MYYDVAVIGGGASGIMAAGRAGERKARTVLIEKNKKLGVKLLSTGGGRCNLTNRIEEIKKLAEQFGDNGKFLFSALNKFNPRDTIKFFEDLGVKTKIEDNNRVFPVSDSALQVLNALISYLKKSQVEIMTGAEVKNIITRGDKIEKVVLADGEEISANKFIFAVGGRSYVKTGSTGDGYKWLEKLGHKIETPLPALVPILVKEKFVKELQGLSLKSAGVGVYLDDKKIESAVGDIIFMSAGVSGPAILNLSKKIVQSLPGKVSIKIDLFPEVGFSDLDKKVQKHFQSVNNKVAKNAFVDFLAPKLIPVIIKLAGVDEEKKVNVITGEERKKIVSLLKELKLEVKSSAGYEHAMVTTGGVNLDEIDPRTMKSKIISNLYLAGEILDLDGPTGGFNLQMCWSTGYLAGDNIV